MLDGTLQVGPEGRIDANVTARTIVIAGAVRGNLSADTRVEVVTEGVFTRLILDDPSLAGVAAVLWT